MPRIDIREQSHRCMERDRLQDQRILQEEQQQFEIKNFRKTLVIAIIALVISLFSLLINALDYFGYIIPKRSKSTANEQHETTKAIQATTDTKRG